MATVTARTVADLETESTVEIGRSGALTAMKRKPLARSRPCSSRCWC